MADKSFFVHLQSLFDFASELQTQLTGMTAPVDRLGTLATSPVLLGDFGEAHSLGASHLAAIAEMSELLGQVQQAIDFAENVTNTVATGYQQADQDVSSGMRVAGPDGYSPHHSGGGQNSLWATAFGSGAHSDQSQSGGTWT
jgi:hypothetical protein